MTETQFQPQVATFAWYELNVPIMAVGVIQNHRAMLITALRSVTDETDSPKVNDFIKSLNLLERRLDELLPKVPVGIDQHDQTQPTSDQARSNWPEHLHQSSLLFHLHLCELLEAWRINPFREGSASNFITVDRAAESEGQTVFCFTGSGDALAFVAHNKLSRFILKSGELLDGGVFVTFNNKFDNRDFAKFQTVYNSAMNQLSSMVDDRRRAINVDGGKIGYMTMEHFALREMAELARIAAAREVLGKGE